MTTLHIKGMMCAHCQARVEKALAAVPGVTAVTVDLKAGTAQVEGTAPAEALRQAVAAAGYEVAG